MKKSINLIFKEKDKKIRVDAFINNKEKSLSRTSIKKTILDRKLNMHSIEWILFLSLNFNRNNIYIYFY